ncbi:hypothetical protein ACFWPH_15830 [Nocardia sp. NPDC058499]|uniref:Rv0361 family membrane protein n=1 Tax=Nocardia sp. NPDC058499 TaxID=3346530 RepID=UPI0036662251
MTNPQYPGAGDQPGGFPPQPPGGPAQPFGGHPQPGMHGPGQNPYPPGPQQYPPQGMQPGYGPPPYPPQPGGPYAPQPGGPYPPQPGKSRGTVVMVTLVVVVLVVGLGVGGYFLLSGGDGAGDPRAVAQQFVDGDGENKELICASDLAKIEEAGASAARPTEPITMPDGAAATSELVDVDVPEGSDKGTFTVKTDVTVGTQSHSQTVEYDLVVEDGDWKVCGILEAAEPGSIDSEAPGSSDSGKPGSSDSDSNSTGGDSGDPRAAAQQFVDSDGVDKAVICAADVRTLELAEKGGSPPLALPETEYSTLEITEVEVPAGGDRGTFTLELKAKGVSTPIRTVHYDLVEEGGEWKVCGVLMAWIS